jgi:hypothetical protein
MSAQLRGTALTEIGFDFFLRYGPAFLRILKALLNLMQDEQAFKSIIERSIVREFGDRSYNIRFGNSLGHGTTSMVMTNQTVAWG